MDDLKKLQGATLYGYAIKDLALVARLLQKQAIEPEDLRSMVGDFYAAAAFVHNLIRNEQTAAINQMIDRIQDDANHVRELLGEGLGPELQRTREAERDQRLKWPEK